ncbi:MAG: SMC-Scp complex subunit ScpB, partial [Planctomycetota bacterium]|nr:SMC-Scp complex subunit ScpB [Planctomycetota bacterium]
DDPREQGVSLEGLSEAFAEALGKSDQTDQEDDADDVRKPQKPAAEADDGDEEHEADATEEVGAEEIDEFEEGGGIEDAEGLPDAYQDDSDDADDPCPISPHTILEAMLFVGNIDNRPLQSRQAAELMRGVEPEEIPEIVDHLNESYAENGCPYTIAAEGAGYRLKLTERFHALRNRFFGRVREARLSQAAIDVLAIVAYRQPITSEDVNRLRDKPGSHILSQLVRRRLLRIERPADKSTKPVYHTTGRFLELFGLDDISELPKSEDVVG